MHLSHLRTNLTFCHGRDQAPTFANIHKQSFPLPHDFKLSNCPRVTSAVKNKWSVARYDPSAWQSDAKYSTSNTRVATILSFGISGPSTLDILTYFIAFGIQGNGTHAHTNSPHTVSYKPSPILPTNSVHFCRICQCRTSTYRFKFSQLHNTWESKTCH